MQAAPAGPLPLSADAPFARLWLGFLTGRVMVALALLVLQGAGQLINQAAAPSVLAVCVAYLVATTGEQLLSPLFPTAADDLGLSVARGGLAFGTLTECQATRSGANQNIMLTGM